MSFRDLLSEARRALGVEQLLLGVHDASFPSAAGEDSGRGSPYGRGARDLFSFAADLGFTGAQLGPQGQTSAVNQSPYDGTAFSKNILSIALAPLADDPLWSALFTREIVDEIVARPPPAAERVHYAYAYAAHHRAVEQAFAQFRKLAPPELAARFAAFRRNNASWLDHDAAFEACATLHGTDDCRTWPPPGLMMDDARAVAERYAFGQWVVHEQHHALRRTLQSMNFKISGDLQVGLSLRDRWQRERLFLSGYVLGAPPSRTDPDGQPWGYPVFDPASEEALDFLRARVHKLLREFDGIRIDHPQGLVCPWVYDEHADDLYAAVQHGARLFDSPDLADHPRLARYAIARPEQLDRAVPRYADGWVRALDDDQVARYARAFDVVIEAARAAGRDPRGIACEILSTLPYPLQRVIEDHGLGRFRVTQKANPDDPKDVYRSEHAAPADWIMVGTHDTPPLVLAIRRWRREGKIESRARYLAERLIPDIDSDRRERFARELIDSDAALTRAMFADLLASPARNVMVFFADLFGLDQTYNRPGIVDDVNWTLRVPPDYPNVYRRNLEIGTAMDVPGAMALALRAKSPETRARADLIESLEMESRRSR